MKKILLISLSLLFANEMEVDGGLIVTGQVNASSFSGDGSALTNLPSLGGMKPDRIYIVTSGSNTMTITPPSNKLWFVYCSDNSFRVYKDGVEMNDINAGSGQFLTELYSILIPTYEGGYIYEYSISTSGTDQGMDYFIP